MLNDKQEEDEAIEQDSTLRLMRRQIAIFHPILVEAQAKMEACEKRNREINAKALGSKRSVKDKTWVRHHRHRRHIGAGVSTKASVYMSG